MMGLKVKGRVHKLFLILVAIVSSGLVEAQEKRLPVTAVEHYLSSLAAMMTGRPLDAGEILLIDKEKEQAIATIVGNWIKTNHFVESARHMHQELLGVSGSKDGINFNLPGNLVAYLVKNSQPYSQVLTADYCVSDAGAKISCDSGAPYSAGLLTTRAFLASNKSRFNLGRANKLLNKFACLEYPVDRSLQPPAARQTLIPMFQQDKAEEGGESFGNGLACYSCHSQFGPHAQFFVKFDSFGRYQLQATGAQDPQGEAGTSPQNLFASHLSGPERSSEASNMFGRQAGNLAEAGKAFAENPVFLQCAVRNTLKYYLKISSAEARSVPVSLVRDVVKRIKNVEPDPAFHTIVRETLSHSAVIESVLRAGGNP